MKDLENMQGVTGVLVDQWNKQFAFLRQEEVRKMLMPNEMKWLKRLYPIVQQKRALSFTQSKVLRNIYNRVVGRVG